MSKFFVAVLLALAIFSPSILAQSYSRVEAGAQASSLLLSDPVSGRDGKAGFGTRFSYNFSSILSLDVEGDFFSGEAPIEPHVAAALLQCSQAQRQDYAFTGS